MAKFRSWNEEMKCFIFFEDGYYTYIVDGREKFFLLGTDFNDLRTREGKEYQFDWQNEEQGFELWDKTIFIGDKIVASYTTSKGNIKTVEGIITMQDEVPVFKTRKGSYFLRVLRSGKFKVIGNIHEKSEVQE